MIVFPVFEGVADKIVIESERSGYLLSPEWQGEIRQRLTMRRNGFLSFTRYYIDPSRTETRSIARYWNIPIEKIMEYFSCKPIDILFIFVYKVLVSDTYTRKGQNCHEHFREGLDPQQKKRADIQRDASSL